MQEDDTEVLNIRDIPPVQLNPTSPMLKARPVENATERKSTYINIPFYGRFLLVNRETVSEQANIDAANAATTEDGGLVELEAELKKRRFKRQLIREGFDPSDPAFQPVPDIKAMQAEIDSLNQKLYDCWHIRNKQTGTDEEVGK